MKQLIRFSIAGLTYGVWKEEVGSVRDSGQVHRLPGNPAWFAGIASVDGKTTCFFDLQACLGLPSLAHENRPTLIFAGSDTAEGFLIESGGETIEVDEGAVHPLPASIQCPGIETAVFHQEGLIPVLNLKEIHQWVLKGEPGHRVPILIHDEALESDVQTDRLRLFTVCGEVFAIHNNSVDHTGALQAFIHPLYARPDHLRGILFDGERIRAVIDPTAPLGYRSDAYAQTIIFLKEGGPAIIVHSDGGAASPDRLVPLPPVASSDLFGAAAALSGSVIPVITISSLLSPGGNNRDNGEQMHETALPHLFTDSGFEVMEFGAAGIIHSVPASQVKDLVPVGPYRRLPRTNPLLAGVAEHNGDILPVIDPGLFFGRRTRPGSDSRMLLMDIDGLRLLLLSDTVPVRRPLSLEDRKKIPLKLPHRFLYGCYIHNNTVRLILDIATIIAHADGDGQEEDWASIIDSLGISRATPGMSEEKDLPELSKSDQEAKPDDNFEPAVADLPIEGTQKAMSAKDKHASAEEEEIIPVGDKTPRPERAAEERVHRPDTDLTGGDTSPGQSGDDTIDDTVISPPETDEDIPYMNEHENSPWMTSLDFLKEHMRQMRSHIRTFLSRIPDFIREKKLPVSIIVLLVFLACILLWGGHHETPDKTIKPPPEKTESTAIVEPPGEQAAKVNKDDVVEKKQTLLLELARDSNKISMRMVTEAPANTVSYIVKKGDTLWHIAERFTGNPYDYHSIARESEIQNPDLIFPGQTVLIAVTGAE